jgi:hypothetical protein
VSRSESSRARVVGDSDGGDDDEETRSCSSGETTPTAVSHAAIDSKEAVGQQETKQKMMRKKKRLKDSGRYVCAICSTVDSPEWREGPMGPRTLCNACGCKCLFVCLVADAARQWLTMTVRWSKQKERSTRSTGSKPFS